MRLGPSAWKSETLKISILWAGSNSGEPRKIRAYFHLILRPDDTVCGITFDGFTEFSATTKSVMREYCRELSERLDAEQIDLDYIIQRWRGQWFEPEGYCHQTCDMRKSILDAAAIRLSEWKERRDFIKGVRRWICSGDCSTLTMGSSVTLGRIRPV